jgi:hypothetical protein
LAFAALWVPLWVGQNASKQLCAQNWGRGFTLSFRQVGHAMVATFPQPAAHRTAPAGGASGAAAAALSSGTAAGSLGWFADSLRAAMEILSDILILSEFYSD